MALKDHMGRLDTVVRLYMVLQGLDLRDIYLSDTAFVIGTHASKPITQPCVKDWGALRTFLTEGGQERESTVEVDLYGNRSVTDVNSVSTAPLIQHLRETKIYDVAVGIYTWNEADNTQTLLWSGFCHGISGERLDREGTIVTVRLSSRGHALDIVTVGDVVQRDTPAVGSTTYPNAPTDSLGAMVPRGYGKMFHSIVNPTTDLAPNESIWLGHGTRGIPGVATDETIASLRTVFTFRVGGTTAYGAEPTIDGTPDLPQALNAFWLYIPEANTFAQLDGSTVYTITNDSGSTKAELDMNMLVFAALRPAGIGTQMSSGFAATAYKLTDDDPNNYIESDGAGNHKWAINLPALSIQDFRPVSIRVVIDAENASGGTRDIQFGLWNDANAAGATWLGNSGAPKFQSQASLSASRIRYFTSSANEYKSADFQDAYQAGISTQSEFAMGHFLGSDATHNPVPIQAYIQVNSASKNGVRIYGIGVIVKGYIFIDRVRRVTANVNIPQQRYSPGGRPMPGVTGGRLSKVVTYPLTAQEDKAVERRYTVLWCAQGHLDTAGSTYEGGAANAPILRGSAVVHHMLDELVPTEAVNATANTLGNFVDARAEIQAGEKRINPVFGPEVSTVREALQEIQRRTPIRLAKEGGTWNCLYDEMNPHSSRFYRSTSDPVKISAARDVVGPVQVHMEDGSKLVNRVVLNYGHSYGSNRPAMSHSYSNPYSLERFGAKKPAVIDEPWIMPETLGTTPEAAKYMAKYYGRVNARPRMTLVVPLTWAFYDLRRGHVLELDTDWEALGFECPAYRCGLLDTMWYRGDTTISPNYANSTAPVFIPSGGVTSETYFIAQGMFDYIDLFYTNTGTYTEVNNGWEYSSGVDSSDEPTWTALTGVTDSDGGDPDTCFSRTGPKRISFTRPGLHLWKKIEKTFGAGKHGPGYAVRLKYTNATDSAVGNDRTRVGATWWGRPFEVIEVTEKFGDTNRHPVLEAVLRECM